MFDQQISSYYVFGLLLRYLSQDTIFELSRRKSSVIRVPHSQSRGPVVKTTSHFHDGISFSFHRVSYNECRTLGNIMGKNKHSTFLGLKHVNSIFSRLFLLNRKALKHLFHLHRAILYWVSFSVGIYQFKVSHKKPLLLTLNTYLPNQFLCSFCQTDHV